MSPSPTELRARAPWPWASWPGRLRRGVGAGTQAVFVGPERLWHAAPGQAAPEVAEGFGAWCAANPRAAVRIVLSARLTHSLIVDDPALPLIDSDEVAAYARAQFVHYHGAAAQAWPIAAWCDGPQRGATALHGLEIAQVQEAARAHRVTLRSIAPWWSIALRAAAREWPQWMGQGRRSGLMLLEEELATWLVLDAGRVTALRQRRLAEASATAAQALLAELQARDAIAAESTLVAGFGLRMQAESLRLGGAQVAGLLDRPHPNVDWLFA